MTSIGNKADYVRGEAARNTTFHHHCHWPDCDKSVPPAMWGCRQHWFKLPPRLRSRIWATYRPGQEVTKTPSREYMVIAQEVQEWIAAQGTSGSAQDAKRLDPKGAGPVRQDAPDTDRNPHQEDTSHDTD